MTKIQKCRAEQWLPVFRDVRGGAHTVMGQLEGHLCGYGTGLVS